MTITSELFEAYLKCPTKCFLRAQGERESDNPYAASVQIQNESYRAEALRRAIEAVTPERCVDVSPEPIDPKTGKWLLAPNFPARAQNLESTIHAVERLSSKHQTQLIPVRYVSSNKFTKDDKLLLAFDALVLSEMVRCEVRLAKLIYGGNLSSLKLKPTRFASQVRKLTERIAASLSSASPPDPVLNRHCAECEFQARCGQKALEKDDLSLLSGMTAKERQSLHGKGIFTVTQLSYTFRPRRRPKRFGPRREKYHHALRALAIRERKMYIVGRPHFEVHGTPVYLDVEGLPHRDFYYLVGVRLETGHRSVQHSFWADEPKDERLIWEDFLGVLDVVENPVLIHYGSFETTFLRRMCARFGGVSERGPALVRAIETPVNILSIIFSQVYFPTYANSLKQIARYLGFAWSEASASGTQSILWRYKWENSREASVKQSLITYNAEDCEALELVTGVLMHLCSSTPDLAPRELENIVHTDTLPPNTFHKFRRPQFQFAELEQINRAAYWDYQRAKILVKSGIRPKILRRRTNRQRTVAVRVNKTIDTPRPSRCPSCKALKVYKHRPYTKTILDVRFGTCGIKRWTTKYRCYYYRCPQCRAVFHNADRVVRERKWGTNLRALVVYQTIELKLSQEASRAFLNQIVGLNLHNASVNNLKASAADFYKPTYEKLLWTIANGRLVHADETKANVGGHIGYVWVFTTLEEVAYVYAPSREADMVQSLLKDFKGVLVSDFYAAYDSLNCSHQKCLIHLIRDLNDDVMKEPFNEEMKAIAGEFASLLKPIIETVDRFGLKARFLRRHKIRVSRFFKRVSHCEYESDTASGWKKRLEKCRGSLFTFLDHDGVPWNNNNAEHAVKAFAMLRRVIGGTSTEKGIRDYLILLSIGETCKFKGRNFLDFLRSGEKDGGILCKAKGGTRSALEVGRG